MNQSRELSKLCFAFVAMVLISIGTECTAQKKDSVKSFYFENELILQKVYQTNLTFEQIVDQIKTDGEFEHIEIGENKIIGRLTPIYADIRGAGYSQMNAPIFLNKRSKFTGFILFEFKEGRYRITLKKITLIQQYNDPLAKQGQESSLNDIAVNKKGEFKSGFKKQSAEILDYTFNSKFLIKKSEASKF